MNRRGLNDLEKNMITCAVLMAAVGIGLLLMGKTMFGVGCIVIGVAFAGIGIAMYMKNPYETDAERESRLYFANQNKMKKKGIKEEAKEEEKKDADK